MAETEFKPGDEVEFKGTGGTVMIFTGVSTMGEGICVWMERGQKRTETFPLVALKKASPKAGLGTISLARS